MFDFLKTPERPLQPRDSGITHIIDKGIGIRQAQDMLETCSSIIDLIKLGGGTGLVTQNTIEKIRFYQKHDAQVYFGGTLFEIAIIQNKANEFISAVKSQGIKYFEISNSIIELSPQEKTNYISLLAKDFFVISEVGSKFSSDIPEKEWTNSIKLDLEAGAWKIIAEAADSGVVGFYKGTGEARLDILDAIVEQFGINQVIFESPKIEQSSFLIKKFGTNVNLGNIGVADIIPVETMRLGLRYNTVKKFHPQNHAQHSVGAS
jgi:phosphosulfolactate synthase